MVFTFTTCNINVTTPSGKGTKVLDAILEMKKLRLWNVNKTK